MSNKLYLECYSGISGDMTAAALLDLGADEKELQKILRSLPVSGFETKISRVMKSGIDVCDFDVILDKEYENHDHDMEYLHGHEHSHGHGENFTHAHSHEEGHGHSHEHSHVHEQENCHEHIHEHVGEKHHEHNHKHEHGHGHSHEHRGLAEITEIINASCMTAGAKKIAHRIFEVLAKAESKAHNKPMEEVHFHEVGAVDSIVDIVTAAFCLDNLNITEVIVPKLYEGQGTVRCQHGILPIPVPAVANIIADSEIRLQITEIRGELVTPTGAAIVAATMTSNKLPESYCIRKIGLGAGKRQYECPGILRAMLIEEDESDNVLKRDLDTADTIVKMETNIDDSNGEALGYVMDLLLKAGARDVHYIPVQMKKNRPGWILTVLCTKEDVEKLEEIIFRETTSIGIRRTEMQRSILKRKQKWVETSLGKAEVKVCTVNGIDKYYPEYSSIEQLCRETGRSYQEVYSMIQSACIAEKDGE